VYYNIYVYANLVQLDVDLCLYIWYTYHKISKEIEVKELKPEPSNNKSADPLEQGQLILANLIASAYLRSKKERQAKFQPDCKTKDKAVQK